MSTEEILRKLLENGSTGCDMSPGDPLCMAAYFLIVDLLRETGKR